MDRSKDYEGVRRMSKKIEMIGRKFHRLTVLKEAERARNGKAMWFCTEKLGMVHRLVS